MTTEQVKGAKQISAYPLTWPVGWKRIPFEKRRRAQFNSYRRELSVADGTRRVLYELGRLQVTDDDIVISTNIALRLDGLPRSETAAAKDPGVAVYWRKQGKMQTMAIDRYDRVADNLAAIAATLEAMRAIERHGGAEILERAFLGFQALPAPDDERPWCEVLGFENYVDIEEAEERYRELAKKHHPDRGGDPEKFKAITRAIAQARATVG